MRRSFLYLVILLSGFSSLFGQNEVENGLVKYYYPNEQVSSEGLMKNGKPDGYWKTYYTTGIIKSEGLRTNFELDSTWTFYNQSGEITQRIDYKYGKKNGYSYSYSYERYSDGVPVSKELYLNDKKEGKAFFYYDNGNIREEVSYRNGHKEGTAMQFDKEGNITTLLQYHNNYLISREYVNRSDARGIKQGIWKTFYPDGRLNKEMYYDNGVLDGLYKEFNPNGTLALVLKYEKGKIVETKEETLAEEDLTVKREFKNDGKLSFVGNYREEMPVGIHRFYNPEGKVINSKIYDSGGHVVAEGIVDETGSKEGDWKDYYLTGEIRDIGNYLDNKKSGHWTYYYKNGKKEQEGNYIRDLPDGQWTWFYIDGNILREEGYFNGREDGKMIEYDSLGTVLTEGDYINGEREGEWLHSVGDHKEKGSYQTGLMTGVWKYYYPGDILRFEGGSVQGQANGKHKFYYPDGTLKEERSYEMGVRENNWKKYDEEGNLTMTIIYRNDVEYRINGIKVDLPKGSVKTFK